MTSRPLGALGVKRALWIGAAIACVLVGVGAIDRLFDVDDRAATPECPGATDSRWTNGVGMVFVRIPAGTFVMGSSSGDAGTHEKPTHRVTISRPFAMATTEVTQAQWKLVMAGSPSRFRGDDLPVEKVSWNDSMEFITKLNAREETTAYRLPTEAEWEYACRAGTAGSWYGELDSIAWYASNSGGSTWPVGLQEANAWGLHDMLGNVYEWCDDWKGEYSGEDLTDPHGPPDGSFRVVRGGSWLVHDNRVRAHFRDYLIPDERRDDVGFRVVAAVSEPAGSDRGR